MDNGSRKLSLKEMEDLLNKLKDRFDKNKIRHANLKWNKVEEKLKSNTGKLWSLNQMELTGGEPDVICFDNNSEEYTFYDCSKESPKGRRSLCYDREALNSRKEHKPINSAMDMSIAMGIEILNEDQYRLLQSLSEFDTKTSSWLKTPSHIRNLGGAIFGDFRYGNVFIYHNGAESYYGARGFRGIITI